MAWTVVQLSSRLFYRRLGIFLSANLLWILCSLPLITLPAATGALFYLVSVVIAEERELEPVSAEIRHFFIGSRPTGDAAACLALPTSPFLPL